MSRDAISPTGGLGAWFWATRPFSLTASVAPVLVGTALATGLRNTNWLLFALALTGSVAIQIGTNLTDEYTDHRRHGSGGKFLAPHKVIQRGLLSEQAILLGMVAAFSYGIIAGLIIVAQVGWPILMIGIASVAAAYFYAGGPYPIGNLGLGEPVVFVFMGPVMVMGAYFVQIETLTMTALLVALPVGFTVTAILHCNNLRDVEEDRAAGKRTIAAILGNTRSNALYATLLAAAYGTIAVLVAAGTVSPWAMLGLLPVPWAVGAVRQLVGAAGRPAMNRVMVRSAQLHGWTGLTLATGLSIAAI